MARDDRCQVARGPLRRPGDEAHARDKLAASDADLRQVVADRSFGTLAQAQGRDKEADLGHGTAYQERQAKLNTTNKPYAAVNSFGGRDYHAPEFGGGILTFTLRQQPELYSKTWDDPTPRPSRTALDSVRQVFDGLSTRVESPSRSTPTTTPRRTRT
ncbi:hypothetical protein RB196_23735 [Streptomyces sp. PmtA]|uniref:hypothetical protein n=1 Tax=Streptomyces sp. PmtA TaxID=3074275 RepID=UPI003015586E